MGKTFFAKIADLINGNRSTGNPVPKNDNNSNDSAEKNCDLNNDNRSDENPIPKNDNTPSNSIDKKGNLLNAVILTLRSNYAGAKVSLKEYSLSLLIDDNLFYNSLVLDKFQDVLITTVIDELGIEFGSVKICSGPIAASNVTKIMDSCYLHIQPIMSVQAVSKAVVSQVPGNGSLIEECVRIDSQEIQRLSGCRYNIGSGKHPVMSDNSHRENQIAIDDDSTSIEFDKNKFVSRAHAHISYDNNHGFILYAEHGGTRAAQKRTHIYRGGEKIELNNILIPEPLQDGDYIVLSKHVHLLFKKA